MRKAGLRSPLRSPLKSALLSPLTWGGSSAAAVTALPQLGSIVFRLSADSLSLSNGDPVSAWVDSINSVNVVQATPANQPTFQTNQVGGLPCVRFDGTNDIMTMGRPAALAAAIDSETYSYICVYKVISAKSLGGVFCAGSSGGGVYLLGDGVTLGQYGSGDSWAYPSNANFNSVGCTAFGNSGGPASSVTTRYYLNGGCFAGDSVSPKVTGGASFSLGCEVGNTLYSNIDLFEVIVWDVELTPTEMMQAQMAIADKYGQAYPWAASDTILVMDGNSHTAGVISAGTVAQRQPYLTASALGLVPGQYTMTAIPGITMANMQAKMGEWTGISALVGKPLRVIAHEFFNSQAVSPATLQATTNSYAATARSYGQLVLATSFSSNTDPNANRVSHAAYYDANFAANCDAYVPLHLNADIGTQTAFSTNGGGSGLNLWQGDGVHLNVAGYAVLAPLLTAGYNALP